MRFIDFQKALSVYEIFSLQDIKKVFPDFDDRRLYEWQKKKYITKLINGWYYFNDIPISETTLFQISNSLRSPSYISLETALSFYGIIPEQAFAITAVTTIKTKTYKTLQGVFFYKTIKPKLFFGYRIIPQKGRPILMAELEKALLDLLYLNPSINNIAAIKALRLNASELKKIDIKKIEQYLEIFNNQALTNRYYILTKTI